MTVQTRLFKKSLLALTVAVASQQAMAAGFQLNSQSATGLGRAAAGDAVIADNAAVMARNPAAMALFDETSLSLGFNTITSDIKVKDAKYKPGYFQPEQSIDDYNDAGDTSIAPNIHLIVPINDKFAVGMNAYTNFGTKTEFGDDFGGHEYGGLTDVKSVNLGLSGSYRVNDQLSFGAGLDVIYGAGTMKRELASGTALLDVDNATGWAVGFNLGAVYEVNENNRFGLAYHYSPEMTAEDDKGQEITLPLPDMVEFSGYHRIDDTKFAVHYSVQWIGWSTFDSIEFDNLQDGILGQVGSYSKDYAWQDGWHYAIGGTYYLNRDWTLRAGYMYDTSAQDELTSVSVPDSDRQWLSAGFTYHINQKSNIDFGFTYLIGADVDVEESTPLLGSSITATTRADAILVGLQYSRSF
ncbi:long-chain fatty acid transporter [Vibrio sp. 10N.286.49.B3]|uniref:outer membrane protein transport protein n=1 Tax=Vibrio sp. 10N.286.49.B3 TaxID=1880855 RepID=UPI000C847AEF|nr:outer membrane protein transport protein [Vibrio sp. 10N.286.49.B3]PMH41814.1 long-chain fatty acid transporter [Vibrio sp. 10N.286.49.B3]